MLQLATVGSWRAPCRATRLQRAAADAILTHTQSTPTPPHTDLVQTA